MSASTRKLGFGLYHVLILVLLGTIVVIVVYPKWVASKAAEKRLEAAKMVIADLDKLIPVAKEWTEARAVAGATSRISLSGPVQRLQEVRRKIDTARFAGCAETARGSLNISMDAVIEGFLKFMHHDEYGSEASITRALIAEADAAKLAMNCRAEQEDLIKGNGKVKK